MKDLQSVGYEAEELEEKAKSIAKRLGLKLEKDAISCVFVTDTSVSLKLPSFSLITPDFQFASWRHRRDEGKKQGLVKACKPATGIKIIDATAGWGKDAAILASFGADVVLVERHPVMALLLEEALFQRSDTDKGRMRLSLHYGSAHDYLKSLKPEEYPDVIYMDPMHPERQKSALVKKEMQILQHMIGPDEDVLELIDIAVTRVKKHVVVKWPQKIAALRVPDMVVPGKTVRFDIYKSYKS